MLTLKGPNLGEGAAVKQYPFPVKAVQGKIKINGEEVRAAQTAGRGKSYTYFTVKDVDYYVAGHLPFDSEFTVEFPTDYAAKQLKVTRIVTKKPKAAKEAKPNGDAHSEPAAATLEAPAADATVSNPFKKGKK